MSPADVKIALQEALSGGVSLSLSAYVVVICAWFLSIVVGGFAGKYFGKRGETAAIQRDLKTIQLQLRETTAATEEIKAQVSGVLWLKQKRWDIKWQCYSEIVENLGELITTISEAIALTGKDQTSNAKQIADRLEAASEQFKKVRRFGAIARIAVTPEVRTRLTRFGDEWNVGGAADKQLEAARNAWLEITDIARADLFGEAREIPEGSDKEPKEAPNVSSR